MIISFRLLKGLIDFDYTPQTLSQMLTSLGIEVEGIRKVNHTFEGIVTGKVLSVNRIKETELFEVELGYKDSRVTVITSAKNLKANDVVGFAPVGSKIANGNIIQDKSFMGHVSQGMLCSAEELGLENELLSAEEKEGIFVLPQDTPVGVPFEEVLPIDDDLLEVSLLPDRADAFYSVGFARWVEILSARNNGRKADFSKLESYYDVQDEFENNFEVELANTNLCPLYSSRIIRNIDIKKSSYELRRELFLLRIRPINNIVDITNL
ncbi:MAG: phenylalanine--tRNA ligase beta subunit-related protein, partial [Caldisericaceae bacterium]